MIAHLILASNQLPDELRAVMLGPRTPTLASVYFLPRNEKESVKRRAKLVAQLEDTCNEHGVF